MSHHKHPRVASLAPELCLAATLGFPIEGYVFLLLPEIQKDRTYKMKIMMVIPILSEGRVDFKIHYIRLIKECRAIKEIVK